MASHNNRLAKETSPYLLQHAHNPVDWFPWGDEALEKARNENKPILVSIGYSACHWCHVMEKESFEDEDTARIMNENFVNIKIDREERPDIDHIYMDAVQAMTGSGGWPLNVFLTPDKKPFYGGTYFPPRPAFNRPSWKGLLQDVSKAFKERPHEIEAQAENMLSYMQQTNDFGQRKVRVDAFSAAEQFKKENFKTAFNNIMKMADKVDGGFGNAPKFPQTFTIQFLLHYYYYSKEPVALEQACLSLDKMIYGGIYDHLGGGFARYSTDKEWLAPHFEKMLYDNALLVIVLSDVYKLTKKALYKQTIEQTLEFIERELFLQEGGFYSALDADSEGVEGKFYVWSKKEVEKVLKEDAALFCELYDVTEEGNWEHSNILRMKNHLSAFASSKNLSEDDLGKKMDKCRRQLLNERNNRIRPQLDDKILLGWNALMNTAYSNAYAALGNEHYKNMAVRNMDFTFKNLKSGDEFHHTYKNQESKYPAFLDDYTYTINALIRLQEITADSAYLQQAKELTEKLIENFSDHKTGFFFYTHTNQNDVIIRKIEIYDGAIPSGNSVMAFNLYYLGTIFDIVEWKERAFKVCGLVEELVFKHPSSFGFWATLQQGLAYGIPEIAIVGKNSEIVRKEFLCTFIPLSVFQSATHANNGFPLLAGKPASDQAKIFLCKNYSCQNPVTEVSALVKLLANVNEF